MGTLIKWLLAALMLFGAVAISAAPDGAPTPAPVVTTPRLYVLDCGTITNDRPEHYGLSRDEVRFHDFADMCYLLVHPKGVLLFDAGLPDTMLGRPLYETYMGDEGWGLGLIVTHTLRSQLADIGYTPDMIGYLLLSHSHFDHIGNVGMFSKATWLVQEPERDYWFGLTHLKPNNWDRETEARIPIMKAMRAVVVSRDDYDIFGDGVAIIKRAYGHTPGSNVLAVHLRDTGWIVLVGDLYHYPEERTLHRIGDRKTKLEELQSRANIEAWAERHHAQIWLTHDMSLYQRVTKSPGYYQ